MLMYKDRASNQVFSILLLNIKGQLRIPRHLKKSSDTKDRKQNIHSRRNLKKTDIQGAKENYENVMITFRLLKEDKIRAGQKEKTQKVFKKLILKVGIKIW